VARDHSAETAQLLVGNTTLPAALLGERHRRPEMINAADWKSVQSAYAGGPRGTV
jgi:hypothetical protein